MWHLLLSICISMREMQDICLMTGSTDRVISDFVTEFSGVVNSHTQFTDPRRITNSSTRQTSYGMTTKPAQYSNFNRQKCDQAKGKLFIISAIAQI